MIWHSKESHFPSSKCCHSQHIVAWSWQHCLKKKTWGRILPVWFEHSEVTKLWKCHWWHSILEIFIVSMIISITSVQVGNCLWLVWSRGTIFIIRWTGDKISQHGGHGVLIQLRDRQGDIIRYISDAGEGKIYSDHGLYNKEWMEALWHHQLVCGLPF